MISRNECRPKMRVLFGRPNGQKTLAEIIKINVKTVKVRTLENRGTQKTSVVGAIWTVPFSLLYREDSVVAPDNSVLIGLDDYTDPIDKQLINLICDCYNGLEPENLACDGEASMAYVANRRRYLNKKLTQLFVALGREVTADEAFDYVMKQHAAGQFKRH